MNMTPFHPYASLYVGDLDSETTESQLFEKFSTYGSISAIRLCRDAITRRSLGYAYVNFYNAEEAEEAMNALNNTIIRTKPCRIMWSQRDPSIRKTALGNIFIKNLHKSIDHKSLHDTFVAFGKILSCKVAMDENDVSRGFGFVHFEKEEDAKNAIEQVNGMTMIDQEVYVGPFIPSRERMKTKEKQGFNNLFIKNFDESMDQEKLKELFQVYGKIVSLYLATDSSGKNKGFGFVSFENPDDAKRACEEMNGKVINNKALFVGRAQKKAERQQELRNKFKTEMANKYQGVNLYVKNLSEEIDDQKLRDEFSPFGTITSAEVMKDDKGNSKGFGFVCFQTPEEASKACIEMNFKIIGKKPIYVALAQRKEQRKAHLQAHYSQFLKLGSMPQPMFATPVVAPNHLFPNPSHPMYFNQPTNLSPLVYHPMMPQRQTQPPQQQQALSSQQSQALPSQQSQVQQQQPSYQQRSQQPGSNQSGALPNYGSGVPSQRGGRNPNYRGGQNQSSQRGGPRQQMGGGGPPGNRKAPYRNPSPNQQQQQPQSQTSQFQPTQQAPSTPSADESSSAVPPIPQHILEAPVLTLALIANLTPEQKKELIGERLFNHISKTIPARAGKVTGMFLESSTIENLISLLAEPEALTEQVQEAIQVLEAHPSDNEEN